VDYYDELFRMVAAKDDESAFRTLFYQFFTPLCAYAMRYIPNREDCEDIVQETFLKLWKNRKALDFSHSFRSFLVTSVKNACIDFQRRQDSESASRKWLVNGHTDASGEDLYAIAELEQILNAALAGLPKNIRITFEMSRFDGKSYTEIAETQQLSVKTVEAYIAKALKMLRRELKDFLPILLFYLYEYF
jgi:RNA polymerase sigma-70 factor (ECF subfamily)